MVKLISRFAPSPTGYIHLGNIKIFFLSWLICLEKEGFLILRIDDTNYKKYKIKYLKNIINKLFWINKNLKKRLIYQTNRLYRYNEVVEYMIFKKYIYVSCENILKNNFIKIYNKINKKKFSYNKIEKKKLFYKKILIIKLFNFLNNYKNLNSNLIILKFDGFPIYNFSSIIDDIDFNINYIIRGIDHLDNIKTQINFLILLKKNIFNYIHVPLILENSGLKMSKSFYLKKKNIFLNKSNILPESLLNYIFQIENKYLSIKNILNNINFYKLKKSYIKLDIKKLLWYNKKFFSFLNLNYLFYFTVNYFKKKFFYKKKIFFFFIKNNFFLKKYLFPNNLINIFLKIYRNNFYNTKYFYKINKKFFIYLINLLKNFNIKNCFIFLKKNIYNFINIILSGKKIFPFIFKIINNLKYNFFIKKINLFIKLLKLIFKNKSLSSKRLGHYSFTVKKGVRIP